MNFRSVILPCFVFPFLLVAFTPAGAGAAAGDVDPLDLGISGTQVYAMALQPDGKMLIAGGFTQILGTARNNIARLNADGTLDTTFDPRANDTVNTVAVQADGKVLLGGAFTSLRPNGAASATTRYYIARVNADGTLDPGFSPQPNGVVNAIAVQTDGKILVGGGFQTVNNDSYDCLARLNVDGSLDLPFMPKPLGVIYCIAVQPDGAILLGGDFPLMAPPYGPNDPRRHIARVGADGWMDAGFDPRPNGAVRCLAVQPDGKVLMGGDFTNLRPNGAPSATTRSHMARVNADGTLDAACNPSPNAAVSTLALQTDGRVLLGGEFTTLSPNGGAATTRNRIARLNTDGTLDSAFNPNANNTVNAVALQADGSVLVGGAFTTLTPNGGTTVTRNSFARLSNDLAMQTLSAGGSITLSWTRGGTAPEVTAVVFELSVNSGAPWTALGAGTRVAGGWQLAGLALPASGTVRARGRVSGGQYAGSTGIIEQVATLETAAQTAVKAWAAGLGVPAGSQGLLDDPDGDGHTNLQEFAFGTAPLSASLGAVDYSGGLAGGGTLTRPGQPLVVGEAVGPVTQWHVLFVRRTNHVAAGITYTVGFSGNLAAWENSAASPMVLTDDGTYQVVKVPFPALVGGLEAWFVRLSISATP